MNARASAITRRADYIMGNYREKKGETMNYGKRLCKSSTDRAICGVCGGIAQYFQIDSIIIRLLMALFCLAFGSGILFYIVAAIVMPSEEQVMREQEEFARYSQNRNSQGGYYGNRSYEEKAASAQDAEFTAKPEEAAADASGSAGAKPEEPAAEGGEGSAAAESASESAGNAAQSEEKASAGANTEGAANGGYRTNYEAYQARQQAQQEQARQQAEYRQYRQSEQYSQPRSNSGFRIIGALLLVFGASLVLRYFIPRIPMILVWATLAIVVGIVLLLRKK